VSEQRDGALMFRLAGVGVDSCMERRRGGEKIQQQNKKDQ
jgi:hypothetical protein